MKAENIFFAESYTVCINLIKQNFEQLKIKKEVFPSPPLQKKKEKEKKGKKEKKKRRKMWKWEMFNLCSVLSS